MTQEHDRIADELPALRDELELSKAKLRYADFCASVYRRTWTKKSSDMTLKDSTEISECRFLDMYPPARVNKATDARPK